MRRGRGRRRRRYWGASSLLHERPAVHEEAPSTSAELNCGRPGRCGVGGACREPGGRARGRRGDCGGIELPSAGAVTGSPRANCGVRTSGAYLAHRQPQPLDGAQQHRHRIVVLVGRRSSALLPRRRALDAERSLKRLAVSVKSDRERRPAAEATRERSRRRDRRRAGRSEARRRRTCRTRRSRRSPGPAAVAQPRNEDGTHSVEWSNRRVQDVRRVVHVELADGDERFGEADGATVTNAGRGRRGERRGTVLVVGSRRRDIRRRDERRLPRQPLRDARKAPSC